MSYVMICCGWTSSEACPHIGMFLESGQHNTSDGLGYFDFTRDINRAMRFETLGEALAFWRKQSLTKPLRADGEPNRPLTAMHATFEKVA